MKKHFNIFNFLFLLVVFCVGFSLGPHIASSATAVTVEVAPTSGPNISVTPGGIAELDWNSSWNIIQCVGGCQDDTATVHTIVYNNTTGQIVQNQSSTQPRQGQMDGSYVAYGVTQNMNYTVTTEVTLAGDQESADTTFSVTVVQPPSGDISISKTTCTIGADCNSVSLSWTSQNSSQVRIYMNGTNPTGWLSSSGSTGVFDISGSGNYTYCMNGLNNSGTEVNMTPAACTQTLVASNPVVVVTPITVSISANPASMTLPTSASTLSWSTTGTPDSCTASGSWSGSKASTGGSQTVSGLSAGSYTYNIACAKSGTASVSDSVTVVVSPAPQICSIQSFSASSGFLVWSTSGCTSQTINGSSVGSSGSERCSAGVSYVLSANPGPQISVATCQTSGINAVWNDTNSSVDTLQVIPGQAYSIPFSFWNSGQSGSLLTDIVCQSSPSGNAPNSFVSCSSGSFVP